MDKKYLIDEIKYRIQLAKKYKMKEYTEGYIDACEAILKVVEAKSAD